MKNITKDTTLRRKRRISSKTSGTSQKPRISVFRSNRFIFVQAIDDEKRMTLADYSSLKFVKVKDYKKEKKTAQAKKVGLDFAKVLIAKGKKKGVFDRGKYSYKGRVKALAEGLREGGIQI